MNTKDIKSKWINKLRTTPENQHCALSLCRFDDSTQCRFCAIGLLAEILVDNAILDSVDEIYPKGRVRRYIEIKSNDSVDGVLSLEMLDELNIPPIVQSDVLDMNDELGMSFNQIADRLTSQYPHVFTSS